MNYKEVVCTAVLISSLSMGCGTTEESDSATDFSLLAAAKSLTSAMSQTQLSYENLAVFNPRKNSVADMSSSNWTDATLVNGIFDEPSFSAMSPGDYLGTVIGDPRRPTGSGNSNPYYNTLSGRFTSALDNLCLVGYLLGGSDLPAAGTYALELTAAKITELNTQCGTTFDSAEFTSAYPVNVVVEDVTSTNFDKKFTIVSGSGDTERTEVNFVRSNATTINVAMTEKGNLDVPMISRGILSYDRASKTAKFELVYRVSYNDGVLFEYDRVHVVDGSEVRVFSHHRKGSTYKVIFGLNMSQAEANASVVMTVNSGATLNNSAVCFNSETGAFVSAGLCSGRTITGTALGDLSNSDTLAAVPLAITMPATDGTGGGWTFSADMGVPSFDATTIFTADVVTNP